MDLSFGAAGDERDAPMSHLVQIFDDLLHARKIIDAKFADVAARGSQVQKRDRDLAAGEFLDQARADFRRHDGDAADVVLHHALGGFLCAARLVVGVAQDRVVAELARARLEPFDDFGKKWIVDVGNDNPERLAVARREMARMRVGKIAEFFDRGEDHVMRVAAHFTGLVEDIGDSRGGYAGGLGDIANGKSHRGRKVLESREAAKIAQYRRKKNT